MSEDRIQDLSNTLNEVLPEDPDQISDTLNTERKQKIIELLQLASEMVGQSPTAREYDALNIGITSKTISRVFGSWNEAKIAAGLELRKRGAAWTQIDEEYFRSINTPEKAYWLGTLFSRSSFGKNEETANYHLQITKVVEQDYFVTEFAKIIGSEYKIKKYQPRDSNESERIRMIISNQKFIEILISLSYPIPGEDVGGFPSIDQTYRSAFIRGYLESSGAFSQKGWNLSVKSAERAETLRDWFEQFGVKRVTVLTKESGTAIIRITNIFDIKTIFDTCWPKQLDTTPSWKPYPEKILQYLKTEYPYPDNISYLSE